MVLLYEPDPALAPMWQCLLEHVGCSVRVATTLDEVPPIAQAQPPVLAVVRPGSATDGWALCRQIQAGIGAPVIGLLPPDVAGEPTPDLHVLPLPVDPRALRELVQLLTTITVT